MSTAVPAAHTNIGDKQIWHKLIRFGFRLLYNELAWTYDAVSWLVSLGDWRAWQLAALPFVAGRDVLEIGHGPGHMLLALAEAGHSVVGLDLSPYMGRQAARRLQKAGAKERLIRGDIANLPLVDATFDTVLATFPTDYIADPVVLAAVKRVLREDGRFLIIPGARLTGTKWLHRFIEWLYAVTGQRETDAASQAIQQLFNEAGFRIEIEEIQLARSAVTLLIAQKDVGATGKPLLQ
ncbi:MAG: methyltransferase domain-containing protein [Chloroflexi bacterium]|nr:methyltransferase domain-containing protein [Chloroflexota bacterium]